MSLIKASVLLGYLQLVAAVPTLNTKSLYTPFKSEKRQSPEGAVLMCKNNACTDCPVSADTGPGYPLCVTYSVADTLTPQGFPIDANGFTEAYVNVPPLDEGCRVIVRSPVFGTNCAGTDLVAQGATCAPLRFDNNFSIFFCCGTGDCGAVGVPRSLVSSRNPFGVFNSFGSLMLHGLDGKPLIESKPIYPDEKKKTKAREVEAKAVAVSKAPEPLAKRQEAFCNDFVPFGDPFTAAGAERPISDTITCGAGGSQPCQIRADRSTTELFGVQGSAGVSGAFKIISASVTIQWSESNTRAFGETFGLDPGQTGYIAFVPRLTCIRGQWIGQGDCPTGVEVTACGPSTGTLEGNIRLVQVRG